MTTFLSKLQYRNYGIGEFTGSAELTPEEITSLILFYPSSKWRYFSKYLPQIK